MGCGTAFRLAQKNSGWLFSQLYGFRGVNDGGNPYARVVSGPTAVSTVRLMAVVVEVVKEGAARFQSETSATRHGQHSGNWTETVLYRFTGGSDGSMPAGADLTFDAAGNIYGTTTAGGTGNCQGGCGTVYKLTQSGGGWTESVLHSFITEGGDGLRPWEA